LAASPKPICISMGAVYFEIAVASWNGTTSAVLSYVTAPSLAFIGDCEFRAPAFFNEVAQCRIIAPTSSAWKAISLAQKS
jgi:hypothetical protein